MAYGETYDQFVQKFQRKKTTDDCYTPSAIYEAVKSWCIQEYKIDENKIIRPFYPDTEFTEFDYTNKIVLDNPPFSILSKIVKFYLDNNVKFFLFAPAMTIFSIYVPVCYIVVDGRITYENGVKVRTSFITNLESLGIRRSLGLENLIKQAQGEKTKHRNNFTYDSHVVTFSKIARLKGNYKISATNLSHIRTQNGCNLFGAGWLCNDKVASMLPSSIKTDGSVPLELNSKEKQIITELNQACTKCVQET